jgi:hypothetical protein
LVASGVTATPISTHRPCCTKDQIENAPEFDETRFRGARIGRASEAATARVGTATPETTADGTATTAAGRTKGVLPVTQGSPRRL